MKNPKLEPDEKCAPSKKYADGSCFSHTTLKKIAKKYNEKNINNKINIDLPKETLVNELENKLSNKCNEQTCWLRLDIVKEIEKDNEQEYEDMVNYTFRPKGPSKKYDWLSTTNINDVIEQYQAMHDDFVFLGAVPVDFE